MWAGLAGVALSIAVGGLALVGAQHLEENEFRRAALACIDGLHAFALSLSRDRELAEDLVQETYLRGLAARHHPPPGDNIRAWLFTILHNVWRNQRRRPPPRPVEVPEVASPGPGVDVALDEAAAAERVRAAVEALDEPFRATLVLRYGEGLSYHEIASVLGCPAGTVMSRLARARQQVRAAVAGDPGLQRGQR